MIQHHTIAFPVTVRFALRELRGSLKSFRIFMACLILGVATIAAVGSLTESIENGFRTEARSMLGGDVEVRKFRSDITDEQRIWLYGQGTVSRSERIRTMAKNTSNNSTLVELRAVDSLYPLYGSFETTPALDNNALFSKKDARWGAAIETALASRLNISVGDIVEVGTLKLTVRALINKEPDKANLGFQLGPSIIIYNQALQESGLVATSSLIDHYYKIKLPENTNSTSWRDTVKKRYPGETWNIRDKTDAAPGMQRFINRMSIFLTLVGLTALVIGGIGVSNAVKSYMDKKTHTIATLKILGAQGNSIFMIYFMQILFLGAIASSIGLFIGAILPGILIFFMPDSLPISPQEGFYPQALFTAALYGLLTTIVFATWPLGKARDIPPVRLFRSLVAPDSRKPRMIYRAIVILSALGIILLAIGLADNSMLSAGFIIGALASLKLLHTTGHLVEKLARKIPRPRNALWRLALTNIYKPGSATSAVVISLGLGLTLFAGIALIESNLNQELNRQVPAKAPAFFFIDIQRDQIEDFKKTSLSLEGVDTFRQVASLRGRVTHLNGVSVDKATVDPKFSWVVRGDRSISYDRKEPQKSPVVKGTWWPKDYKGLPEISMGDEAAKGLGLHIGDTVTLLISGRSVTTRLRSLREITWGNMGFNFVIMLDPYTGATAPHNFMASFHTTNEMEEKAYTTLTRAFPAVTAIRVKDVINKVNSILTQIGSAIRITALVAIIAGIFVLAGAITAGFEQRVYDTVILKVLGAVRRQILLAYVFEYLFLGLVTAFIALLLGSLTSYLVINNIMEMTFVLHFEVLLITILTSLGVTIIFGLLSSLKALGIRPNKMFREK